VTLSEEDKELLREVGMRVRLQRVYMRLSQEELGTKAGITRSAVGSIERGDHPASVLAYGKVAKALGIKLDKLMRP
jgi:transcriptional regulator with XRE-family HTH domain